MNGGLRRDCDGAKSRRRLEGVFGRRGGEKVIVESSRSCSDCAVALGGNGSCRAGVGAIVCSDRRGVLGY